MEKQLISDEIRKKIEGYYVEEEEIIYDNEGKRIGIIKRTRFIEPDFQLCMELYKKHFPKENG